MCVMASAAQTVSGNVDNHEYVDLGLPSGTLWATCNMGAAKSTEYGDLFAWGETETKDTFWVENYKFYNIKNIEAKEIKVTKYNTDSTLADFDGKAVLESQNDVAFVSWGGDWRMPTKEELQELANGCDWEWTANFENSGAAGRIGKSKTNGNTIFLPGAGFGERNGCNGRGHCGFYWSCSLVLKSLGAASCLFFNKAYFYATSDWRYRGFAVRAVCSKK